MEVRTTLYSISFPDLRNEHISIPIFTGGDLLMGSLQLLIDIFTAF